MPTSRQTLQAPGCAGSKHGKGLIAVLRGGDTWSLALWDGAQADGEMCVLLGHYRAYGANSLLNILGVGTTGCAEISVGHYHHCAAEA
jgi:hypothetical protein